MLKTKEQLLLEYKKANKQRRSKIVEKAGYSTEMEYLAFLMKPDDVVQKPVIHNVHIIDVSSSMNDDNKIKAAIDGVNEEIKILRTDPNADYLQTIVQFSDPDKIRVMVDRIPINNVGPFHTVAYGWTALYKALGETLERMRTVRRPGETVLVKVFTDGGENRSSGSKFGNRAILSQLIKDCENDNFTITFVGTETDVKCVIDNLGVDESNTYFHDNTFRGVGETYGASASATMLLSQDLRKGKVVTKGFYKKLKDNK